jgi:hypothetical protein
VPGQKLTGDLAQTSVGIAGGAPSHVFGLMEWTIEYKVKSSISTTPASANWEESLSQSASWSAKAKYAYLMGDASQKDAILAAIVSSASAMQWVFFLDDDVGDLFTCKAYIDGITLGAGVGKIVGLDVSLKGTGPLLFLTQAENRANAVAAGGTVAFTISRSLGITEYAVIWEIFNLITTPLPGDAIIQGIYPVFIGSANLDAVTDMFFRSGTGFSVTAIPGTATFTSPSNPDNSTFASTEFYGPSIGTSLAALTGQQIMAGLACSLDIPPPFNTTPAMTDLVTITGVGYAILYTTSAAPVIDAAMPPPFAVPSGQGLTWAMPTAVSQTGVSIGGGSIFSPSGGVGVGTPFTGEL